MTDVIINPVVSISFRKVVFQSSLMTFKKVGEPVLQIEVLGDQHTLEDVGKLLFKNYLGEILDEELDEHLWRFEPCPGAGETLALDPSVPILSDAMHAANPFEMFRDRSGSKVLHRITENMDLLFRYDEGSPTHLMTTIESIAPMPEGKNVNQYPAKKTDPNEHLVGAKRKRIEETPALTIPMDEAYPFLRDRLLHEHRVSLEMGRGSDPIPDKLQDAYWARIWGGDPRCSCDRSLESRLPFENLNEAFFCFDRAIQMQVSPDFPACTGVTEYKNRLTGAVCRRDRNSCLDLSVTANVLPAAAPKSAYAEEMEKSMMTPVHRPATDGDDVPQRSWMRYCFNFALQEDWRSRADLPDFSFTKQFPKVTAWLTRPGTTSHWLSIERGVMCAVKGKNNPRAAHNVVHKTLKHTSLQAMFTEMEELLVLAKSGKCKK